MLPKIVLHKKNGHSHAPKPHHPSLGDIIRQVHAGGQHGPKPTFDLLKFASVVRTEKRTALLEQAVRHVDGLTSALNGLLARTEAAFKRGELQEVQSTLESLRGQAGEATKLFARLLASAETRASEHGLVNVNELIADAAERARAQGAVAVVAQLDPSAPCVIGNARRLERALVTLVGSLAGSQALTVEASQADGVMHGEKVVRLEVRGDGELSPMAVAALGGATPLADSALDLDVHLARQIVAEHGGAVSMAPSEDGGSVIRIELPAV
jgi:C4-dicarboxylate-specific signal transduction histidine kinase